MADDPGEIAAYALRASAFVSNYGATRRRLKEDERKFKTRVMGYLLWVIGLRKAISKRGKEGI
jgi:hypothetical protein